jgi:hypothetical protein
MGPLAIGFLGIALTAVAVAVWVWTLLRKERAEVGAVQNSLTVCQTRLQDTLQRHKKYAEFEKFEDYASQRANEIKKQKAQASALAEKAKQYAVKTKTQAKELAAKSRAEREEIIRVAEEKAYRQVTAAQSEVARVKSETRELITIHDGLQGEVDGLRKELGIFRDAMEMADFGLHIPEYDFDTPDEYKQKYDDVRARQKDMIKCDRACPCDADWTVEGSAAKGKRMVKQHQKLALRAFNGDSDACIASVKHSNIDASEKRLRRSFDAINKLGREKKIEISETYFELKRQELVLKYEWEVAKQKEKEEQKAVRDQIREEERAQRELEKAQKRAEKEATDTEKALQKARAELLAEQQETAAKNAAQVSKLQELVAKLEGEYASVLDKKARAVSRAQLTRSGYVYILSNIGAYGNQMFKIGLTRRLDPQDRVTELSGAAVPFPFDVHAMIYAEDAPALESALHNYFADRRVNLANTRKEFFHVTIDEIEKAFAELHGDMTKFRRIPDATQYMETLAIRKEKNKEIEVDMPERIKKRMQNSFVAAAENALGS